jgi:selenoprotein W-related protein
MNTSSIVPLRSAETVKGRGARAVMFSTYTSTSLKASEGHLFPNNPMWSPYFENISIEYCPGCRWMTKAFWMATELLQQYNNNNCNVYQNEQLLREVTVIPSEPGTFTITAKVITPIYDETDDDGDGLQRTMVQLWDRKVDGGFPPIDLIEFEARVKACLEKGSVGLIDGDGDDDDGDDPTMQSAKGDDTSSSSSAIPTTHSHVVITYYGKELLTTFCDGELDAISLRPESGSPFRVELREHREKIKAPPRTTALVLWDNDIDDNYNSGTTSFPEVKELKRLVRDKVIPQKDLGHSDEKTKSNTSTMEEEGQKELLDDVGDCLPCNAAATSDTENDDSIEEDDDDDEFLDDDEAEEARRYFGVM